MYTKILFSLDRFQMDLSEFININVKSFDN